MPTSELSDALNPYASQARQRQQQNQYQHNNLQVLDYSPEYSPQSLVARHHHHQQQQQQQQHVSHQQQQQQYQYQPVVQPVQQHVPHVSELEMAITEPIVPVVSHVVATSTRPNHQQLQLQLTTQPQDPNIPNPTTCSQVVLTDLMHMLLATQRAQEEERQRRIAWEKEQEVKYTLRQADMEVKMVQMLDELKALRSTVNALNEPLPSSTPNDNNNGEDEDEDALGDIADDNHVLGLVLESGLGSSTTNTTTSSGLVSPPTTVFSPALSQLSTTTSVRHHHHHHLHPVTPTSPIIHPAFPHSQAQPSPHPMFMQGSSTPANLIPEPEPEPEPDSALSQTQTQIDAPYQENTNDTFQLSLSQAEYTITPEQEPETLDESSDRSKSPQSQPQPKAKTGKRKKKNQKERENKKNKNKKKTKGNNNINANRDNNGKEKTKKITHIPASPDEDEDDDDEEEEEGEEEHESSDGSSSDSLSTVERRPRKRRNHHDTRCYTIQHAMRTHILQMMGLESDKELPDSHVESSSTPSIDPSTSHHHRQPIRFIWNKTTKQSSHNAHMKKLVISDLKDHRRSATYKHLPASEFTKKLMDAAFEQCFVTLRQKFKSQRDENVALKVKVREEGKARRARHLSRRRIKLENRSEARIQLSSFEHVIFDGALHQDCMSSEDSEIEIETPTSEPTSIFRTRGYTWRSKRLLRFYAILDEQIENPDANPTSTLKRKRGTGKRERRSGSVKESFSLPPEGVSRWMLSKRWYKESKAKYPDFEVLMGKLVVTDAGTTTTSEGSASLGFRELGEESGDEEDNEGTAVTSVPVAGVAQPSTCHAQYIHQDSFRVHLHSIDMGVAPQQLSGTSSTGLFMNYTL